jgi:hypothetical protein
MKKNLTSLTKYTGCSGKVMEAGDHFKNGAKPKSQMSRGNFKLFALLLTIVLIIS